MSNILKYTFAMLFSVLLAGCSDEASNPPAPTPEPEPEEVIKNGSLKGTIIGTEWSVDYNNGNSITDQVNVKECVFDGKFNTFFASYLRSGTWVGLDLGEKHIITKIGYSPRINQPTRVQLAIIEGANKEDFSDAVPIHIIKEAGEENKMNYADINCSKGFRYVRYIQKFSCFFSLYFLNKIPTDIPYIFGSRYHLVTIRCDELFFSTAF